jgi:hypothetical protein
LSFHSFLINHAMAAAAPMSGGSCQTACSSASNPYAKGGARGSFVDTVINENSWAAREPAHRLFSKIAANILNAPLEPKYRKLNIEKVIGKFGADFKGIAELLRSVGFVAEGPNLVLPESTVLEALCQAKCAWDEREARSAAGRAEALRILEANKALVESEKAKKEASRAAVKSLAAQAREDVAAKPVMASKGNDLRFGATQCKAPPPPPAAKGG